MAKATVPSVVSIATERTVTAPDTPFDFFGGESPFEFFFGPGRGAPGAPSEPRRFRQSGLGSGFLIHANGTILTNNHVVEGAQKLKVQLSDEREYDGKVVGTDPATDLAVVKLSDKAPDGLAALPFGDSDQLQMGEWVVAIGAPFGLNESITAGIISAKGRQNTGITPYGNFLQTDAAINPGNSGGPLVNLEGRVVGINTAIYSQSGGYQGVGFAIPINLAKSIADSLIKHGKVTRGWLGVSIQSISPEMAQALGLEERKGALVADVVEGGPAQKAGIQRGDVIVRIGGEEVSDANDLMNRVALLVPGSDAEITVRRDGKEVPLKVQIGKRDEQQEAGGKGGGGQDGADVSALGLSVADLSDALRSRYGLGKAPKQGAVIVGVEPGGLAAGAGLREGDVILEANRRPVASAAEFRKAIGDAGKGKGILLLVRRGESTSFVVLTPDSGEP